MTDRTEEDGLAARLNISVGGEPVTLRTLNLNESEDWLKRLDDVGKVEGNSIPVDVALDLALAYDIDGVLTDARTRFTKRELFDALNQMASAEDPFALDARSMVGASGLFRNLSPLLYLVANRSLQASSTNGASQSGASTRRRSGKASLKSVS